MLISLSFTVKPEEPHLVNPAASRERATGKNLPGLAMGFDSPPYSQIGHRDACEWICNCLFQQGRMFRIRIASTDKTPMRINKI